jgi:hypothetical protein
MAQEQHKYLPTPYPADKMEYGCYQAIEYDFTPGKVTTSSAVPPSVCASGGLPTLILGVSYSEAVANPAATIDRPG